MSQQINVHLGHCKTFVMATIFLKFGKTAFLKVQLSLYTKLFIIFIQKLKLEILHKLPSWLGRLVICGIAGENRPTGAKIPMEIIDL